MFAGHIFSAGFWRSFWIALRRSRRDRRDRKNVLKFTLWLLFAIGYYGYLVATVAIKTLVGPILLVFLAIFLGMALLPKLFHMLDKREAEKRDAASIDPEIRTRLAQDCVVLATLLARASSESFLKQKQVPAGVEVTTRRVQIDSLKKLGRWDLLPNPVRDLLLLPDGHWSEENIHSLFPRFEILRCLRWTLGVDEAIEPLTAVPKMNYELAEKVIRDQARLQAAKKLVASWDLRVERNKSDIFFSRCYSEAVGRGHVQSDEQDEISWLAESYERARQPEVRDLLAGVDTISEVEDFTLHYLLSMSFHRYRSLQLLIAFQTEPMDWADWEQFCFPSPPKEMPVAQSSIL